MDAVCSQCHQGYDDWARFDECPHRFRPYGSSAFPFATRAGLKDPRLAPDYIEHDVVNGALRAQLFAAGHYPRYDTEKLHWRCENCQCAWNAGMSEVKFCVPSRTVVVVNA